MPSIWSLQEAKNRFSEVVERAQVEGPQWVTRHGKKTAVLLSAQDFQSLTARDEDLVMFFQKSPLTDSGIDLSRNRDTGRAVDL